MPWKNGKGVTIEIAIHPADADVGNFDWRLSTATVDSDGPFSVFEGIDRSLSVLTGDGLVLSVEGRDDALLTLDSEPLTFPADAPTSARLTGGTITDLNAMSRRGRAAHQLGHHPISGPASLVLDGDDCLVFCGEGRVTVAGTTLAPLDCLRFRDASGERLEVAGEGRIYLAQFRKIMA